MTFGEQLKQLRLGTGKSQAQVAKEIAEMFPDARISQTYISALESKDLAPRGETLEILAQYFKVHPSQFIQMPTFPQLIGIEFGKEIEAIGELLRLYIATKGDNQDASNTRQQIREYINSILERLDSELSISEVDYSDIKEKALQILKDSR